MTTLTYTDYRWGYVYTVSLNEKNEFLSCIQRTIDNSYAILQSFNSLNELPPAVHTEIYRRLCKLSK